MTDAEPEDDLELAEEAVDESGLNKFEFVFKVELLPVAPLWPSVLFGG